ASRGNVVFALVVHDPHELVCFGCVVTEVVPEYVSDVRGEADGVIPPNGDPRVFQLDNFIGVGLLRFGRCGCGHICHCCAIPRLVPRLGEERVIVLQGYGTSVGMWIAQHCSPITTNSRCCKRRWPTVPRSGGVRSNYSGGGYPMAVATALSPAPGACLTRSRTSRSTIRPSTFFAGIRLSTRTRAGGWRNGVSAATFRVTPKAKCTFPAHRSWSSTAHLL